MSAALTFVKRSFRHNVSQSLKCSMIELYRDTMKASRLLAENIAALLNVRHGTQTALAQWCGHSVPWLNAILLGKREMQFKDLDRVADFFGLAAHQLMQPGIAPASERRFGSDRRKGQDRRLSVQHRIMTEVGSALHQADPRSPLAFEDRRRAKTATDDHPIQALVTDLERGLGRLSQALSQKNARRQATRTGRAVTHRRGSRRTASRSKTAKD